MIIDSPHEPEEIMGIMYFTVHSTEASRVQVDVFERGIDLPVTLVRY